MTSAYNCARHSNKEKMKCFICRVSSKIFLSVSIFQDKTELESCETAKLHSRLLQVHEFQSGQAGAQLLLIMLNAAQPVCFCPMRE